MNWWISLSYTVSAGLGTLLKYLLSNFQIFKYGCDRRWLTHTSRQQSCDHFTLLKVIEDLKWLLLYGLYRSIFIILKFKTEKFKYLLNHLKLTKSSMHVNKITYLLKIRFSKTT